VIWINFTTPTKWLMDFSTDLDRVVVNYYYTHHAFKRHVVSLSREMPWLDIREYKNTRDRRFQKFNYKKNITKEKRINF
jgi:hypothetical protein